MKWAIPIGLLILVLVVYSIPIFHEAGVQKRVLKISLNIISDLMDARHNGLKEGKNCGLYFNTQMHNYDVFYDDNKDGLYDASDTLIKKVQFNETVKDVVYSKLFDQTGSVFDNNTVIFDHYGKVFKPQIGKNSIFIIGQRDEADKVNRNVTRIMVTDNGKIDLLKVTKVFPNGDLAFKPI